MGSFVDLMFLTILHAQFLVQAQSFLSINRLPASERDMVLSNSMAQKEAQGRFDSTRLNDLNEQIFLDCPAAQVCKCWWQPGWCKSIFKAASIRDLV